MSIVNASDSQPSAAPRTAAISPLLAEDVLAVVQQLCADDALDFPSRCANLEARLNACDKSQILQHLNTGGIISEAIDHDSSEEKLLAKYSDVILACALRFLGFDARVLEERSDAADVYAVCGQQSLVGDGKIFRLTRTALNPKDYKVPSLAKWRAGQGFQAKYSVLLAPSFQFPKSKSQLYAQAVEHNVLLLSFEQLAFLVTKHEQARDYQQLWEYPGTRLALPPKERQLAKPYWAGLDALVAELSNSSPAELSAVDAHPELTRRAHLILTHP